MAIINRIKLQARALRKHRRCLNCNKLFMSSGPGNRRCSKCAKDLAHVVVRSPVRCFLDSSAFFRLRDSDLIQDFAGSAAETVTDN